MKIAATPSAGCARTRTSTSWMADTSESGRAASRGLRTPGDDTRGDGGPVGCGGAPAGGHLAALGGPQAPPAGEKVSSRVQAVCDWYGPSDLLTMPSNLPGPGKTDADL